MLKVLRHGNTIEVEDPVTKRKTRHIVVTFIEEGRAGGNSHMSETSQFLSDLVGENVGLEGRRIHSHPVREDKVGYFPIHKDFGGTSDKEHPGHINRGMYSEAQIEQQVGVDPAMIDGQPTYFLTWIGSRPEEDVDKRMSNESLAVVNPMLFNTAARRRANVRVIEDRGTSTTNQAQINQGSARVSAEPAS